MTPKKRKRMLMLTDGNIDNASARIRAIQYIPFFKKQGFKVNLIPRIPQKPLTSIDKYFTFPLLKRCNNLKMILAILFGKWEIVYIQRFFVKEYLLKLLNKREIPIIYDFDDAIYINERCPGNRLETINMIRYAFKVIISTDYLQAFCVQNGKTAEVINTPVETDRIRPTVKPQDHLLTIGWIGSPWTSGFLEIVEKPLQRLAKKYTFCFLTIGAKQKYTIEGINHVARPWSYEKENEDLGNMDIGIMPLPDTDYAGMKGGYKLILYMSAGIACVASPVGINQMIVEPGENGFLASNEEEWFEKLELLIKDSAFRTQLGDTGRQNAIELYSREVCFKKLLNIIQEI
jgi:glycosyltransferase involved in cell wall biosynthesis